MPFKFTDGIAAHVDNLVELMGLANSMDWGCWPNQSTSNREPQVYGYANACLESIVYQELIDQQCLDKPTALEIAKNVLGRCAGSFPVFTAGICGFIDRELEDRLGTAEPLDAVDDRMGGEGGE